MINNQPLDYEQTSGRYTIMLHKKVANKLRELDAGFGTMLLDKHLSLQPALQKVYGSREKNLYIQDTLYHIKYLSEAIGAGEQVLFNEYFSWAKTFFTQLKVNEDDFILNLELIRSSLFEVLPTEMSSLTSHFITEGIEHFKKQPHIPPSFIKDTNPQKDISAAYLEALLNGDKREAQKIVFDAFSHGVSIKELYLNVFQPAQQETGRLWQLSKVSVAQEHFITACTQLMMALLYPNMFTASVNKYKIIVACIEGELHEIGARMVADLFEMDGWSSYYFGANIPKKSLLKAISDYHPDVVALSATMTFHISQVAEMIELIRRGMPENAPKILVGGYPFQVAPQLWERIGADGFAPDALSAISLADNLVQSRKQSNVH